MISNYHKAGINNGDADFLVDLENQLRKPIPISHSIKSFGVLLQDNRIIGLNLSDQKLKIIPDSVENLKALKILNLSQNKIEEIPDPILKILSLQKLDISENILKIIPRKIWFLFNLRELRAAGNRIEYIPSAIGRVFSLELLDLSRNNILIIPESIGELELLKNLDLSSNGIKIIPEWLENLSKKIHIKGLTITERFRVSKAFMNPKFLRIMSLKQDKSEEEIDDGSIPGKYDNLLEILPKVYYMTGKYDEALELLKESLNRARYKGDLEKIWHILDSMGFCLYQKGEIFKSNEIYSECLKISQQLGNHELIADSILNLEEVILISDGRCSAQSFVSVFCETTDKKIIEMLISKLIEMATYSDYMRSKTEALENFHKALYLIEKIDDLSQYAECTFSIGDIYNESGELDKAIRYYNLGKEFYLKKDLQNEYEEGKLFTEMVENEMNSFHLALESFGDFFFTELPIFEETKILKKSSDLIPDIFQSEMSEMFLELKVSLKIKNFDQVINNFKKIALFHKNRSDFKKSLEIFQNILKILSWTADNTTKVEIFLEIAEIYKNRGDIDSAYDFYSEALIIAKSLNDKDLEFEIHDLLNYLIFTQRFEFEKMRDLEDNWLMNDLHYDPQKEFQILNDIGRIFYLRRNFKKALKKYQHALAVARITGDKKLISMGLDNLILVCLNSREFQRSLRYLDENLAVLKKLDDSSGLLMSFKYKAKIYRQLKNFEKSKVNYEKSLEMAELILNAEEIFLVNIDIANLYDEMELFDRALEFYLIAFDRDPKTIENYNYPLIYNKIGILYMRKRNEQEAQVFFQKGFDSAERVGDFEGMYGTMLNLKRKDTDFDITGSPIPYMNAVRLAAEASRFERDGRFIDALLGYFHSVEILRNLSDTRKIGLILPRINALKAVIEKEHEIYQKRFENPAEWFTKLMKEFGTTDIFELSTLIGESINHNDPILNEKFANLRSNDLNKQEIEDKIKNLELDYKTRRKDPLYLRELGIWYSKLGDKKKYLYICEMMLELEPKNTLIMSQILLLYSQFNEYDKFINLSRISLSLSPDFEPLIISLALGYQTLRNYEESIVWGKESIKINSNSSTGWGILGLSYSKLGKYHKSIECYQNQLNLAGLKGSSNAGIGEAYEYLGDIEKSFEYYNKSIVFFEEDLINNPNDSYTWNSMAWTSIKLKRYKEAMKYAIKGIENDQNCKECIHTLGIVYKVEGNFVEAKHFMTKAYELDKNYAYPLLDLAEIHISEGNPKEAMGCLEKAIEIDPQWIKPWEKLDQIRSSTKKRYKSEFESRFDPKFNGVYQYWDSKMSQWYYLRFYPQDIVIWDGSPHSLEKNSVFLSVSNPGICQGRYKLNQDKIDIKLSHPNGTILINGKFSNGILKAVITSKITGKKMPREFVFKKYAFKEDNPENEWDIYPEEDELPDVLNAYFEKYLGDHPMIYHEPYSPDFHLDLYQFSPREKKKHDFFTIITNGMSTKPMLTPKGMNGHKYAELMIHLPKDWPLQEKCSCGRCSSESSFNHKTNAFKDPNYSWPISWIYYLARMPFSRLTWLGLGHTIPMEPPLPVPRNCKFSCWLLKKSEVVDMNYAKLRYGDKIVNIYTLVPLFPKEVEFKLKYGYEPLVQKFREAGITDVINIKRKSVI